MNMSRHRNNLRKNYVIKLLTEHPDLRNVDVSTKVQKKYGIGMAGERINKYRKLADFRSTNAIPKKPISSRRRSAVKPVNVTALPFHDDVKASLELLKTAILQHYNGGVIYINVPQTGEAVVKYHLQPKPIVPMHGKTTL